MSSVLKGELGMWCLYRCIFFVYGYGVLGMCVGRRRLLDDTKFEEFTYTFNIARRICVCSPLRIYTYIIGFHDKLRFHSSFYPRLCRSNDLQH
jgi:hypothetical protein